MFRTNYSGEAEKGGLVRPNNFDKYGCLKTDKIFYVENLNLSGDNNIYISVFALLSLKICVTDEQFLHCQRQLFKPLK